MIDVEGLQIISGFEVTDMMEDGDPYLTQLGLDWVIAAKGVVNLKYGSMTLENNGMHVLIPLKPTESKTFLELDFSEAAIRPVVQG